MDVAKPVAKVATSAPTQKMVAPHVEPVQQQNQIEQ